MTTPNLNIEELQGLVVSFASYNRILRAYEAASLRTIESVLTVPPSSPADGLTYLIGTGATGSWSGRDNQIAYSVNGSFNYLSPNEGYQLYNKALGSNLIFNSGAWSNYLNSTESLVTPSAITLDYSNFIFIDSSSASLTHTLPTPGYPAPLTIRNTGANDFDVTDGTLTLTVSVGSSIRLFYSTAWNEL